MYSTPNRKMVQRCLQLSLRIASKLRSLPSSHPLHAFCLAATRNFCGNGSSTETDSSDVSNPRVVDSRPGWHNRNIEINRVAESWQAVTRGDGDLGGGEACRRYSNIVQEVVMMWFRDPDAVDLDPLWLLLKLRTYKNW